MKMIDIFEDNHPLAKDIPTGLSVEKQLAWYCEPLDDNHESTQNNLR